MTLFKFDKMRQALLYTKDMLQFAMSRVSWFAAFNASPVAFVVRALLRIISPIFTLSQTYDLIHAAHKSLDAWVNTLSLLTSSVLSNISTYGGILARILGFSFAAAPWIFIAALGVGVSQSGLALYQAYKCPGDSQQQKQYVQTAINHGFQTAQFILSIAAFVCATLLPIAPFAVTLLALSVIALIIAQSCWRSASRENKTVIKELIGLNNKEENNALITSPCFNKSYTLQQQKNNKPEKGYPGFFSSCNETDKINLNGNVVTINSLTASINFKKSPAFCIKGS